jgi:hypothetical protein
LTLKKAENTPNVKRLVFFNLKHAFYSGQTTKTMKTVKTMKTIRRTKKRKGKK